MVDVPPEPAAPGRAHRVERGAVAAIALFVVGAIYWRLYYGVNVTDESFYVAVPYRLTRGAQLFVDDSAVAQGFVGLLLYPFVRGYEAIAGLTGIVLFVRHLHLLFALAVALTVAVSLRTMLELRRAVLVGLAFVAFAPFNLFSLGYDNLGCGFFTAGCLLGLRALQEGEERRDLGVLTGLCLGLAIFCYQPLAVAVATAIGIRWVLASPPGRRGMLRIELPALLLPLVAMAALVALAGVHRFNADLHARSTLGEGTAHKLAVLARHQWYWMPHRMALLAAVLVLVVVARRLPLAGVALVLLLPFLVLPPDTDSFRSSLEYVANYGLLALPLFAIVQARPGAKALMLAVWVPGAVGGIVTGLSSASGALKIGIGAFPALVATTVFLVWVLEDLLPARLSPLSAAPAIAVLGLLLSFALPTYLDGSLSELDARIGSGPFAGLHTTAANRDLLDGLRRDLAGLRPSCRIAFYDFPAGYLLTRATPDAASVWPGPREDGLGYYADHPLPDVTVVVRSRTLPRISSRIPYGDLDPLLRLLRGDPPFRLALERPAYAIYRRGTAQCGRIGA